MASILVDGVLYCCIYRWHKLVYSCNVGPQELESIAKNCLKNAPQFHAWYFEISRGRTHALLTEDVDLLFFAIGDPSSSDGRKLLRFLRQLRERFKESEKRELPEVVPITRRQRSSPENVPQPEIERNETDERTEGTITSEEEPQNLLRPRNSERSRRSKCLTAVIVVAAELVVCLIFVAIWAAICRGFQCIRN